MGISSRCIALAIILASAGWSQQVAIPPGPPPRQSQVVRRTAVAPAQQTALPPAPRVDLGPINDSVRTQAPPRRGLLRVAVSRPVPATQMSTGVWQNTPAGMVWRMALRSDNAIGVRLHFTNFNVGSGQVWIHDTTTPAKQTFGPYTGRGRNVDGDFWTEIVFADTVEVEYTPAAASPISGLPPFTISEISHLWRIGSHVTPIPGVAQREMQQNRDTALMSHGSPFQVVPPSIPTASRLVAAAPNYSCFLDAACYADPKSELYHPEVADALEGTAYLVFGNFQCTGTILNAPNANPLMLTAGHCIATQSDAESLVAVFNVVDQSCQTNTANFSVPTDAQLSALPQANGVRLLSFADAPFNDESSTYEIGNDIDYSLILLDKFPVWSNLLLSGYSSYALSSNQQVTGISAAQGLFLTAAFGTVDPQTAWFNGYDVDQSQTGRIDVGSSGSGMFDGVGHLLGVLSTGTDPCNGDPNCTKTSCDYNESTGGYPFLATYTSFASIYPYIRDYLNNPLDTAGTTLPDDPKVFSALPLSNINSYGYGIATLNYNAPAGVNYVEIHVGSPNGALFAFTGPSGQIATGQWATDGMTFYLQDVSNNQARTLANTLATVTVHRSTVMFTATPPFFLAANGENLGYLTINWDVPGATKTEVHIASPTGPLFAYAPGESAWANTGYWVRDGLTFVLCNVSQSACSAQNVVATLTVHVTPDGASTIDSGSAVLFANPNPITVNAGQIFAQTMLSWNAPGATAVEVRVGSATGPLFAYTGPQASAATGTWVTDGTTFYLQDVTKGEPGTTVGTATVYLTLPPP